MTKKPTTGRRKRNWRIYVDPLFGIFVVLMSFLALTTDRWLNDITLGLVMLGTFSALLIYDQLDNITETFSKLKAWIKKRF